VARRKHDQARVGDGDGLVGGTADQFLGNPVRIELSRSVLEPVENAHANLPYQRAIAASFHRGLHTGTKPALPTAASVQHFPTAAASPLRPAGFQAAPRPAISVITSEGAAGRWFPGARDRLTRCPPESRTAPRCAPDRHAPRPAGPPSCCADRRLGPAGQGFEHWLASGDLIGPHRQQIDGPCRRADRRYRSSVPAGRRGRRAW
jgi:hypothetical protein